MKAALRAGEKERLGVIRMALAAIKQREVDDRTMLDDAQVLGVLEKMVKQRHESIAQYRAGGRDDLADKEQAEISILQEYLPQALSEPELRELIDAVLAETGATSMKEMGKVMGVIKAKAQGRVDMGRVSAIIKERLGA